MCCHHGFDMRYMSLVLLKCSLGHLSVHNCLMRAPALAAGAAWPTACGDVVGPLETCPHAAVHFYSCPILRQPTILLSPSIWKTARSLTPMALIIWTTMKGSFVGVSLNWSFLKSRHVLGARMPQKLCSLQVTQWVAWVPVCPVTGVIILII